MIFHVLTIFPEFFEGPFAHGVVKRAKDAGLLEIRIHNLRDWTHDRLCPSVERVTVNSCSKLLRCNAFRRVLRCRPSVRTRGRRRATTEACNDGKVARF